MKIIYKTYKKIAYLLMSALLVPTLVFNIYIFFHNHDISETHYHHETVICDHDISLCECSDFIFTLLTYQPIKIANELTTTIFEENNINFIKKINLNLFLGYKKGRSPPIKQKI